MADQRIVDELYQGYEKYISEIFLDAYGKSYMTYETIGDGWRQQVPYTPEAEKLLIAKSILFMRVLNSKHPYARDIRVLEDMGLRMAKYLSVYKMRATELPDNRKERDAIRKAAKIELQKLLVEKNSYISELRRFKDAKRVGKYKPNSRKSWLHSKNNEQTAAPATDKGNAPKVLRKRKPMTAAQRVQRAETRKIRSEVRDLFINNEWNFVKRQK